MAWTLLIVDDEKEMCSSLSELFSAKGFLVETTSSPKEVINILQNKRVDLILMDVRMPEIGGISLLKTIRDSWASLPIIMISGYASIENVVQSMRYGALNFYEKPLNIPSLMNEISEYLLKNSRRVNQVPIKELRSDNPVMQDVLEIVKTAAPTNAPVIITGESGTGKERVAAAIHEMSGRGNRPLIKINCAAIPDTLLESELFGYEAGAFTDARTAHRGKFEQAEGGSIFFDEIGDMSLKTQAKLLRVLQEKEFERLGGNELIKTDVRVITATNKDLKELIANSMFREDLYYRISVISVHLLPLRERMEDIISLSTNFLHSFCSQYNKHIKGFAPQVESVLINHDWPGNIRELRNVIERSVIFSRTDMIELADLPAQYKRKIELDYSKKDSPGDDHLTKIYNNLSRQVILDTLKKTGGSKNRAAELLNIHRKTLYNRMKKYGISGN